MKYLLPIGILLNMKKIIIITLIILNTLIYIPTFARSRKQILENKTIVIDPGHGGLDKGTSYKDIFEKDINLKISLFLKEELEKLGASVIMTRVGDYDLSYPNATFRKKSDFNNRIKIINENNVDFFLSIHQNYFNDSKYGGVQIFYKENKVFADFLQKRMNKERKTKKIPEHLYMYKKIKIDGLLIECGFLSNHKDRTNLIDEKYQKYIASEITKGIVEYIKLK